MSGTAASGFQLPASGNEQPGSRQPGAGSPLAEIRDGLDRRQKQLSPKFFYDERGSELFERITELPEYYPSRVESALLAEWMPRWVGALRPGTLVELGAGSARKTRLVLDAMVAAGAGQAYLPVDISAEFLESAAAGLRGEYPSLEIRPVVADIGGELELPGRLPEPVLVAFLGSTIGNFEAEGAALLLGRVSAAMGPHDRFLLGVDLRKDPAVLEAAYDDAEGVTAEFNLNMLRVLNDRFGADFDLSAWRHMARYDRDQHRIEMHLVSTREQTVRVPGAGEWRMEAGESIRTEISCKHDRGSIESLFARAGLEVAEWATDEQDRYALVLGRR